MERIAIGLILVGGIAACAPPLHPVGYFPNDPFHLSPVPDVPAHGPNYLPRTVPDEVRLIEGEGGRIAVYVTPNVVPYHEALAEAAEAAQRHCARATGRVGADVVFDTRRRHAPANLESWVFAGRCT